MVDVVIAGAGPMGSYAAERLSSKGFHVMVMEEHEQVGYPVHCAGIVSERFLEKFHIPEDIVQNRLTRFRIFAPHGRIVECPPAIRAAVVDRRKLDEYYAGLARQAGALFSLSSRVIQVDQDSDKVYVRAREGGEEKTITAKLCILATGSMSNLPFRCGIDRPHFYSNSFQVEAVIEGLEGVELYLGNDFAPGSFAYAVSVNSATSKIGIMVRKRLKQCFDNLVGSPYLEGRIVRLEKKREFRRIPLGFPESSQNGRICALGDAAGQLKTTTGGGIYYGLLSAGILAETIVSSRKSGDFDTRALGSYDRKWKRVIGKELRMGLLFRRFIEYLSDDDFDAIFSILQKKDLLDVVEREGDFDFHQHLVLSLLKEREFHRVVYGLLHRGIRRLFQRRKKNLHAA
ncbi:MAG: NAD(P)/FAD-dependent oxidoreductase [Candidatus Eremiobacteraeota bacterium]|nr:NAD(P)/FAD-dependent oxidoreductase [Candidatus Eremiobacteraeota bacterium]